MLSKQSIEKYREIYRKQFGLDISVDDAAEQANRLLNLARVVLQPMPKTWERRYIELLSERRERPQKLGGRKSKSLAPRRRETKPLGLTVAISRGNTIIIDKEYESQQCNKQIS